MADAVFETLRAIWAALAKLKVDAALMGGASLGVWRAYRTTLDVDLLVAIKPEDIDLCLTQLASGGFHPRRKPPLLRIGETEILLLQYEPRGAYIDVPVDFLLVRSDYQQEALKRAVQTEFPGSDLTIRVMAAEDLILHKLIAARMVDQLDVVNLLRSRAGKLDEAYLNEWAERLGLTADLDAARAEATKPKT